MTVTFLVEIDLDDGLLPQLAEIAADITEDLEAAGHSVNSVKPWARPSTGIVPTNLPPV